MIVHDFHVEGVSLPPFEADTPAVVDADAVLAGALAPQRLQPVAGRHGQVFQARRGMELEQLAAGRPLDGAEAAY